MTVRPTISRQVGEAIDPGTQLAAQFIGTDGTNVTNTVPIIRVREMESVLKLVDGQIGVLGGLMQDDTRTGTREVPGLSQLPGLGELFFDTEELVTTKSELVVFLRPVVVEDPSLNTDLSNYEQFLRGKAKGAEAAP